MSVNKQWSCVRILIVVVDQWLLHHFLSTYPNDAITQVHQRWRWTSLGPIKNKLYLNLTSLSRSKLFNGGMRAGQIFQVDQLPSLIVLLWCQEADKSNSLIQSFALCPVVGKHLVRSHIHSRSMDMLTTASNWLVLLLPRILTAATIQMIELPTQTVIIIETRTRWKKKT